MLFILSRKLAFSGLFYNLLIGENNSIVSNAFCIFHFIRVVEGGGTDLRQILLCLHPQFIRKTNETFNDCSVVHGKIIINPICGIDNHIETLTKVFSGSITES